MGAEDTFLGHTVTGSLLRSDHSSFPTLDRGDVDFILYRTQYDTLIRICALQGEKKEKRS